MYAAPFDTDVNKINDNDNIISKKRSSTNKTQKRYSNSHSQEEINSDKVDNILQKLHNLPPYDNDNDNTNMGDFNPPPFPQSMGVESTKLKGINNSFAKKASANEFDNNPASTLNKPSPGFESSNYNEDYYKRFIPDYDSIYKTQQYMNTSGSNNNNNNSNNNKSSNDILIEKLNYMIHLLEEQQDEKTGNVIEEVLLYSFIGIFVIFVIDSFTRFKHYKR